VRRATRLTASRIGKGGARGHKQIARAACRRVYCDVSGAQAAHHRRAVITVAGRGIEPA
jgi:hypothetical protein